MYDVNIEIHDKHTATVLVTYFNGTTLEEREKRVTSFLTNIKSKARQEANQMIYDWKSEKIQKQNKIDNEK